MKIKLSGAHSHPEELPGGLMVAPGEVHKLSKEQAEHEHVKGLLDIGTLIEMPRDAELTLGSQRETVGSIEARIETATDTELDELASDDRAGVREAVDKERKRRGGDG